MRWSVSIAIDGKLTAEVDPDAVLATASMGKLLLLAEAARQFTEGSLSPDARVVIEPADAVGDSGLLQWMHETELSLESLAVLIAGVSDNLATNALLRSIGLDAVDRLRAELGLESTRLLDRIRDTRLPGDPPWPSQGSAAELRALFASLADGSLVSAQVSARTLAWLQRNTDLSMVAAAWGLDPLAHSVLANKTGSDAGVRADAGVLRVDGRTATYAVLASWDPSTDTALRAPVMRAMRAIGEAIGSELGMTD